MQKPRAHGQGSDRLQMPSDISVKKIALGAAIGVAVALAAALALALLISMDKLGAGRLWLWAGVALFLGGLVAGALSGGARRLLVTAGLTALVMLALVLILGAAAFGGSFSPKICLAMLIILLLSCIIGSVLASFAK